MQSKEDDQGNFSFTPSQFLTTSQIKSYFSRLTRSRRRSNQPQSSSRSILTNEHQEEEVEEAENEFDSIQSNIYDQSIQSIAEERFHETL